MKKNSNMSLLDCLCPRADIGSLEGKRKKKAVADGSGIPHPIFNGLTQKELLDRKVLSKAFRDAEHRELQAIKELRTNKASEDEAAEADIKFECEICLNLFHPSHVPLPKAKSQPTSLHDIKFLCPSCLRSRRPRIELILSLLMNYNKLSLRLPEGEALTYLADRALAWQTRAEKALKTDEVVMELKKFKEDQKAKNEAAEAETESESESEAENPKLSAMKKMPEVKLSHKTQNLLEDLLLEGDLMEVTMDENQQIWKLLQAAEPRRSKKYPDLNQLEAELETAREEKLKAKKKRKLEAAASASNGEAKKAKLDTLDARKRKGGRSRKKDSEDEDRDEEQEDCSAMPKCLRPIGKEVSLKSKISEIRKMEKWKSKNRYPNFPPKVKSQIFKHCQQSFRLIFSREVLNLQFRSQNQVTVSRKNLKGPVKVGSVGLCGLGFVIFGPIGLKFGYVGPGSMADDF